jgi:molybdate transport system regulatory protein
MVRSAGRRTSKPAALAPRVKVWLETGGRYAFGHGLSDILQAVDRTGSIKQGAADLGKSYRYVWGRVKKAEQALGRQLVETQVGGQGCQRSTLTPEARHLVTAFLALRSRMTVLLQEEYGRCFAGPMAESPGPIDGLLPE